MIEIMHSKYNNVRKIEKITKIKKKKEIERLLSFVICLVFIYPPLFAFISLF